MENSAIMLARAGSTGVKTSSGIERELGRVGLIELDSTSLNES